MESWLESKLWKKDSVTGRWGGSYLMSTWRAEEAICHNWDLIRYAMLDGMIGESQFAEGPETVDVFLRCYVLGKAIQLALEELGYEDDI